MKKFLSMVLALAMIFSLSASVFADTGTSTISITSAAVPIDFTIPTNIAVAVSTGGQVSVPSTFTITNNMSSVQVCLIDATFTTKNSFTILDSAPSPWTANSRNLVMDIGSNSVTSLGACRAKSSRYLIPSVDAGQSSEIKLHITTSPWTNSRTMEVANVVFNVGLVAEQKLYLVSSTKNSETVSVDFHDHFEFKNEKLKSNQAPYTYAEGIIVTYVGSGTYDNAAITEADKLNRHKMGAAIINSLGTETVTLEIDVRDLYNAGDKVGVLTTETNLVYQPSLLGVYTVSESGTISIDVANVYGIFTLPATGDVQ